jgi:hypothetical protein
MPADARKPRRTTRPKSDAQVRASRWLMRLLAEGDRAESKPAVPAARRKAVAK